MRGHKQVPGSIGCWSCNCKILLVKADLAISVQIKDWFRVCDYKHLVPSNMWLYWSDRKKATQCQTKGKRKKNGCGLSDKKVPRMLAVWREEVPRDPGLEGETRWGFQEKACVWDHLGWHFSCNLKMGWQGIQTIFFGVEYIPPGWKLKRHACNLSKG